ncbi:hypothetical protein LRS05_06320 [Flavobacterium sp. J372]|uniref:hypothetical protein n=1 Tax=Flavobacterium sp. J372 TaxID=2898436 RepID=UPI002151DE64|nr:hypothetical protein [Flavobacterium sp. J372]MCR5861775.1 hypothetical protein [Flavobacterium sp. J372]
MTTTDWISAISSAVTTLLTVGILLIAYFQIRQIKEQLSNMSENQRTNTLMTVLELESELNKRKESFDNVCFDLREYNHQISISNTLLNLEKLEIVQDKISVAKENYLNSLDRLSYCIIHKYLSDRDWKTEYRDVIFDVVDNHSDCFGVTSRFRNTKKLYEKWKSE